MERHLGRHRLGGRARLGLRGGRGGPRRLHIRRRDNHEQRRRARQVYHAVETADFYSGASPDGFPWGQRLDCGCFDSPPEGLPTREQAREYHSEVRMKVTDWIRGMDAPEILAREKSFPWTGSVVLGKALYLLGHYRQHFGEINAELRRRGLPRIEWTTF